jgi:hypothetical protein
MPVSREIAARYNLRLHNEKSPSARHEPATTDNRYASKTGSRAGCAPRSGRICSIRNTAHRRTRKRDRKMGICKTHARDMDDPTLTRSDWWPWLTRQSWFRHDSKLSQHYPRAVEAILQPREDRKAFFQRVLNPGVPVSRGYQILAELLARRVLRTVLTTNFDSLLASSVEKAVVSTSMTAPGRQRQFDTGR